MKTFRSGLILLFVLAMAPLFKGNQVMAQSTTPQVIISEFMSTYNTRNYLELTNVGDTAVNLVDFEVGNIASWVEVFHHVSPFRVVKLPEYLLQPGESYLIAMVNDYRDETYNPWTYEGDGMNLTPLAYLENVDLPVFRQEKQGEPTDSISPYMDLLLSDRGRSGFYVEYHFANGDSVICDAVKNDVNENNRISSGPSDVAGVYQATNGHHIIRKAGITRGTTDWDLSRGISPENSEWIVIPLQPDFRNSRQQHFTTLRHHGIAQINASTFRSNTIEVDFENNVLNVPWGIYRDSIMFEFDLGKGLAWTFSKSPEPADSIYYSLRTSDTLTMWAVGTSKQEIKFRINVTEPSEADNHVLPIYRHNDVGTGYFQVLKVTEDQPGLDSIVDVPYGFRTDSLFKYLEKPVNAEWEIVWVDGSERPDLKRGDILKVTAANSDVKEYFIAADAMPEPSHNAKLAAITWPDVPEVNKLSPEWDGKIVIPGFSSSILTYQMKVPVTYNGIPALAPEPENLNARISVNRAKNLNGSVGDRTTTITVTAEDDTTVLVYNVLFEKEKLITNDQPFFAEPIVSQMGFREMVQNNYIEIFNPGNRDLDLSNYMISVHMPWMVSNPAQAISYNTEVYEERYLRYFFGYDYVTQEEWASTPSYLVPDLEVDPIIGPGETFVISYMTATEEAKLFWAPECDVIFTNSWYDISSIPGVTAKIVKKDAVTTRILNDRMGGAWNDVLHIFKITNTDVLEGIKASNDPADFKFVELVGDHTNTQWKVDGVVLKQQAGIERKPQYWKADTIGFYSFGDTPETSQWELTTEAMLGAEGVPWPYTAHYVVEGLGSHQIDPITIYKSTINTTDYLASEGYVSPQTIIGIEPNTTVETFMDKIIKADTAQSLSVISSADGSLLTATDDVADGDTLVVLSADSVNKTKYVITVSEGGLDDDAVLVAKAGSGYTIEIDGTNGTISGIPFGSSILAVVGNVTKPSTASMSVINTSDEAVSLYTINFDTVQVETKASHLILLEVVAQNSTTIITYQLEIDLGDEDALLFSDKYSVDQSTKIVSSIPTGTRVQTLFTHLQATVGATMNLYDKAGNERTLGDVAYDDKVVVTSSDGSVVNTYYLNFLEEAVGLDAYLLSDILQIDQLALSIDDVEVGTAVDDFLNMLIPAPGATMLLVDTDGNEVTTGDVEEGFSVIVTSASGTVEVTYKINLLVSTDHIRDIDGISAYPNPTSGEVFITGLRENSTVRVINMAGSVVKAMKMDSIFNGQISIADQPDGIYFIAVTAGEYHLKTMKVVKR